MGSSSCTVVTRPFGLGARRGGEMGPKSGRGGIW